MYFKSLWAAVRKYHKKQYLSQNTQIHNEVRKALCRSTDLLCLSERNNNKCLAGEGLAGTLKTNQAHISLRIGSCPPGILWNIDSLWDGTVVSRVH